jgi:hypothetical protein
MAQLFLRLELTDLVAELVAARLNDLIQRLLPVDLAL